MSSICDGASVNVKYGRDSPTENQLCHAHGIHLAVTGVIYKKIEHYEAFDEESDQPDENENDDDNDENETEDDSDGNETEDKIDLHQIHEVSMRANVAAIGKIVKMFKRSDKNNQILQIIIKDEFGHEIALKLDCPTRYNFCYI